MTDKARIAYLTSPAPGVFVFNYQIDGTEGIQRLEISQGHLANIIVDGASFALRPSRSPFRQPESADNERATAGA